MAHLTTPYCPEKRGLQYAVRVWTPILTKENGIESLILPERLACHPMELPEAKQIKEQKALNQVEDAQNLALEMCECGGNRQSSKEGFECSIFSEGCPRLLLHVRSMLTIKICAVG